MDLWWAKVEEQKRFFKFSCLGWLFCFCLQSVDIRMSSGALFACPSVNEASPWYEGLPSCKVGEILRFRLPMSSGIMDQ